MQFIDHKILDISIPGFAQITEPRRNDVDLSCSICFSLALMLRQMDQDDVSIHMFLFYVSYDVFEDFVR